MTLTYTIELECPNCRGPVHVNIPKGTSIDTFLVQKRSGIECTTCGIAYHGSEYDRDMARLLLIYD